MRSTFPDENMNKSFLGKSYNFDDHDDSDDEDDHDLLVTLSSDPRSSWGRSVMSHAARGQAWVTVDQSEARCGQH